MLVCQNLKIIINIYMKEEKQKYKDKRFLKKTKDVKYKEFVQKHKNGTIYMFIDKFIYDAF